MKFNLFLIFLVCLAIGLCASRIKQIEGLFAARTYVYRAVPITPPPPQEAIPLKAPQPVLGATIPVTVTRFETSLQANIGKTDTSMTLVKGTDAAGNSLSGYTCFTLDDGTSAVEDVCGTAAGTAISGMTRGISPVNGSSSVAALEFAHRRGASVKITDSPQIPRLSRILNGDETLPNRLIYDSSIATTTFTTYNLVNKQYVDGVALQGAPTATTTTAGIVTFATLSQLSSGTFGDGSGHFLVPPNYAFNYTPQTATGVPVSNALGKLNQSWFDLSVNWPFTSTISVSGTSTLATTTVSGVNVGQALTRIASSTSSFTAFTDGGSGVTTTVASLTFTPVFAQKVQVNGTMSISQSTAAAYCWLFVSVDNAATSTVWSTKYGTNMTSVPLSANFSYLLPSQMSAASHTVKLSLMSTVGGGQQCTIDQTNGNPTPQFNAFYMGN